MKLDVFQRLIDFPRYFLRFTICTCYEYRMADAITQC